MSDEINIFKDPATAKAFDAWMAQTHPSFDVYKEGFPVAFQAGWRAARDDHAAELSRLTARIAELEKRAKVCPNCAGSIGEHGRCDECAACESEKDADIATLTAERDQLRAELEESKEGAEQVGRVYLEVCQDAVDAHAVIDQLRAELAAAKAVVEKLREARDAANALDDAIKTRCPDECEAAHERKEAAGLAPDTALAQHEAGKGADET